MSRCRLPLPGTRRWREVSSVASASPYLVYFPGFGSAGTDASELIWPSLSGSAGENSSVSPGLVWVLWIVPAASSSTECAERHADSRQGATALLTFFTLLLRFR